MTGIYVSIRLGFGHVFARFSFMRELLRPPDLLADVEHQGRHQRLANDKSVDEYAKGDRKTQLGEED